MKKIVFLFVLIGIFSLLVLFKNKKETDDYPTIELSGNNIININKLSVRYLMFLSLH